MHYLVIRLEAADSSALDFMEELTHVEAAARVSYATLIASANTLISGLKQVKSEMRTLSRLSVLNAEDKFLYVMNGFVQKAEPDIQGLSDLCEQLEQQIKDALMLYGEDPASKPEEFFAKIASFSTAFQKAREEVVQTRKKKQNENKKPGSKAGPKGSGAWLGIGDLPKGPSMAQGDLDDAIRELRSGYRRKRSERVPSRTVQKMQQ